MTDRLRDIWGPEARSGIRGDLPPGVASVRFSSDLTLVAPIATALAHTGLQGLLPVAH